MTEDMSTRPRPRLRAERLTLGRWCALQAVRRTAVAPEPTGASAEGSRLSSPAPYIIRKRPRKSVAYGQSGAHT